MNIKFLENEYWYGGCTSWGTKMPLDASSTETLGFSPNLTPNQAVPLLLSNQGRYLWLEGCDKVEFDRGTIRCPEQAQLSSETGTLRDAYLAASRAHFPTSGQMPAEQLFRAPIFNTWIEFTFHQCQHSILQYARDILANGFEPGVLMIDDSWAESYGDWRFHSGRFPDPRGMLEELHAMGFQVMLWICPYVTPDTLAFRDARKKGLLLTNPDDSPFLADWWNGYSAALDLLKPEALEWFRTQLDALQALGVDGFKLDGGDPPHYLGAYHDACPVSPNAVCHCWTEFGAAYPLNEFRASWNAGGMPLFQRLSDKDHSWGSTGIQALIPDTLAQGITGHPFGCPDMVGGGEYLNFEANSDHLERELFVKHAAAAALMPSIQFSASPWRILTPEQLDTIRRQLALRSAYLPRILAALKDAAETGEPAVRYMEYAFPGQGCEAVTDQFLLGDRLLIAPILEKGTDQRRVYVPAGRWRCQGETFTSTGEYRTFSAPDTDIVILEQI